MVRVARLVRNLVGAAGLFLALAAALASGVTRAAAAPPAAKPHAFPTILFHYPTTPEHVSFVIEINAKGQTTKVRSMTRSGNREFDEIIYGNVVQTFVREDDGKAIAGVYRMNYAYNPKNRHIRRTVTLIKAGGVDPGAESLVDKMIDANRLTSEQIRKDIEAAEREQKAKAKPSPKPTA